MLASSAFFVPAAPGEGVSTLPRTQCIARAARVPHERARSAAGGGSHQELPGLVVQVLDPLPGQIIRLKLSAPRGPLHDEQTFKTGS